MTHGIPKRKPMSIPDIKKAPAIRKLAPIIDLN
jgi:hypothetical protein